VGLAGRVQLAELAQRGQQLAFGPVLERTPGVRAHADQGQPGKASACPDRDTPQAAMTALAANITSRGPHPTVICDGGRRPRSCGDS